MNQPGLGSWIQSQAWSGSFGLSLAGFQGLGQSIQLLDRGLLLFELLPAVFDLDLNLPIFFPPLPVLGQQLGEAGLQDDDDAVVKLTLESLNQNC